MTFVDPRLTERRNPRSADIDLASPLEIVDLINAEDQSVPVAVASQRQQIAKAIAKAEKTFRNKGRLFYVGAGTSGRRAKSSTICNRIRANAATSPAMRLSVS